MIEARWNDSKDCCCSADNINDSISCLLSMTFGSGYIYIYENNTLIKKVFIK